MSRADMLVLENKSKHCATNRDTGSLKEPSNGLSPFPETYIIFTCTSTATCAFGPDGNMSKLFGEHPNVVKGLSKVQSFIWRRQCMENHAALTPNPSLNRTFCSSPGLG